MMILRSLRRGSRRAALALALAALALGACTNSKLIVGPLYNRLDDRVRAQFEELGDFDERQTALFDAAVGTAHVWHRRSELPAYARLLGEIAASVAEPGRTTVDDVTRWARTIEAHAIAARECHPVNFSTGIMRTLTDAQVDGIERHLAEERAEYRERHASRTPEERVARRLRNLRKWAGRIGLDFTAEQNALLRGTLAGQTSLRREYRALSDRWNEELFRLARDRTAPDFDARMRAHLADFWTLLEREHPEPWRRNRELWRDAAYRFVASMTPEQREVTSAWLAKMGETLAAVARDEPSFDVGDDPSVGCLVGPATGTGAAGGAGDGEDATG